MPALLKRLAFQVGNSINERTCTYSSVSDDGHFISLRPLVKPYTEGEKKFPFEWAFAGLNKDVTVKKVSEDEVTQDFDFWLDSNRYLNVPNTHKGIVNTNWKTWESGCMKETGTVFPFGVDKPGVEFMELWQPLDASQAEEAIAPIGGTGAKVRSIVLKADTSKFQGLMIVVGQWIQGYLSAKGGDSIEGISFIRAIEYGETIFEYGTGVAKFPRTFDDVEVGSSIHLGGVGWEVIEANF